MPGKDQHLTQISRLESFLKQLDSPEQPYKEWVVIVWFHIAIHYVDAFLAADRDWKQIDGHSDRTAKMGSCPATRAIIEDYHRLYKEAKQARYECTEFTKYDLDAVRPLYESVRNAMRRALGG
jgi:CHAD domain-containing protein